MDKVELPYFWNSGGWKLRLPSFSRAFRKDVGISTRQATSDRKLSGEFSLGLTMSPSYSLHLGSILLGYPAEASVVMAATEFHY